ncbi:MAG: phosphonoacetaldehyde reductase [Clostridia bacterium]|nr:phosphonoacetaldehyde reductase [Clostridia bacterium]
MQRIIRIEDSYRELYEYIRERKFTTLMIVVDSSFEKLSSFEKIMRIEKECGCRLVRFSDFVPNPLYSSVEKGVELFKTEGCEAVMAVGGGSAIDVAKCIKLYATANTKENYLAQKVLPNDIELIAVPTTAGTGSEATRFSVVYHNGEKQSVSDESIVPHIVVLDAALLYTLPSYQKKSTLCDAFFHAAESFWSINSTSSSKETSKSVILRIIENYKKYLSGDRKICAEMQIAAYDAGRAINITQTTAGHAMSYKLTSMFGISHGQAVALANCGLIEYMIANTDKCIDVRGKNYLKSVFEELSEIMGGSTVSDLPVLFDEFVDYMQFEVPTATPEQLKVLSESVNPVRLKNNPVSITPKDAYEIYKNILTR